MNYMKLAYSEDDEMNFASRKPKPFRKNEEEEEFRRKDKKREKQPDYSLNRKAKRGEDNE